VDGDSISELRVTEVVLKPTIFWNDQGKRGEGTQHAIHANSEFGRTKLHSAVAKWNSEFRGSNSVARWRSGVGVVGFELTVI